MCRLRYPTYKVKYHPPNKKAHPFGQSFLSAAVRIGSLAVRMAAFLVLRCGGVGEVDYMGRV